MPQRSALKVFYKSKSNYRTCKYRNKITNFALKIGESEETDFQSRNKVVYFGTNSALSKFQHIQLFDIAAFRQYGYTPCLSAN